MKGTKAGAWLVIEDVPANGTAVVRLRFYQHDEHHIGIDRSLLFGPVFEEVMSRRKLEADQFYETISHQLDREEKMIGRQASAGLLWSKQFYHYVVRDWLGGDRYTVDSNLIFLHFRLNRLLFEVVNRNRPIVD